MKKIVPYVIVLLIGFAIAQLFKSQPEETPQIRETIQTSTDTVSYVCPRPLLLKKLDIKPIKLPKLSIYSWGSREGVRVTVAEDSATLEVPIESKVYTDDSTYRAVVSGFMASLDTIDVYNRTIERTISISGKAIKPPRWGISVGVGAVATPTGRIEPGIFAGVSYTFLTF